MTKSGISWDENKNTFWDLATFKIYGFPYSLFYDTIFFFYLFLESSFSLFDTQDSNCKKKRSQTLFVAPYFFVARPPNFYIFLCRISYRPPKNDTIIALCRFCHCNVKKRYNVILGTIGIQFSIHNVYFTFTCDQKIDLPINKTIQNHLRLIRN